MLEVIAQSVDDAKVIEAAGAHRIELVSGISEGGLTPSYGMIEQVVKSVKIPVNVMIRPHSYSFEYKPYDIGVMKQDMKVVESLGVNGIVIGCLNNREVDFELLKEFIESINCEITFHRAIDETLNPSLMFRKLTDIKGINQVLTSGGPGKACDNFTELDKMYSMMSNKLLIGSGVTLNNIPTLVLRYPNANYHIGSDARVNQSFRNRIDEKHIKMIVQQLDGKCNMD
ncbi:MAG: copper homeostasis protein CutC [Clostridiales bacterium]|nr:copper homeostasis protein CutC [Clostridiales bacterium]